MANQKGVAGIFDSEEKVLEATRKVKDAGFRQFEVITPYPVHGMEEAAGIQRSWLPWVTFFAAIVGLLAGLALTYWTSAVNWPINIGGKPMFSLPAFVPIMFELTILFAALSSVGALFVACGLPKVDPPIIDPDLSCHKFCIFIPATDRGYEESKVEEMLKSFGAETKKAVF